jgi:hypothetical protein
MSLEDIMLSEISQPQEDKCCTILPIWDIRVAKVSQKVERWFPEAGGGRIRS